MRTSPSVWVLVLTHGGAEEITASCIESLLAQDYDRLTVLLVDNASYDGSGARLRDRYPSIRYLNTGGNFGYTGGNNRGAAYAMANGAEYLVVLNNDTVVEPGCMSTLARSAAGVERLGAIAPKILYYDDPSRIWYAGGDIVRLRATALHRGEMTLDDPAEPARLEPMTFATGCCFLIPVDTVRRMGGPLFEEDFFIYAEDLDLSLRLGEAGYGLYYQPAARVLHREPQRPRDATPFQIRHLGRNRRRIARRRYGLLDRLKFTAFFYPTRALRLARYVVTGDWERARAQLDAVTLP